MHTFLLKSFTLQSFYVWCNISVYGKEHVSVNILYSGLYHRSVPEFYMYSKWYYTRHKKTPYIKNFAWLTFQLCNPVNVCMLELKRAIFLRLKAFCCFLSLFVLYKNISIIWHSYQYSPNNSLIFTLTTPSRSVFDLLQNFCL